MTVGIPLFHLIVSVCFSSCFDPFTAPKLSYAKSQVLRSPKMWIHCTSYDVNDSTHSIFSLACVYGFLVNPFTAPKSSYANPRH